MIVRTAQYTAGSKTEVEYLLVGMELDFEPVRWVQRFYKNRA
jgi:hypothetical protein